MTRTSPSRSIGRLTSIARRFNQRFGEWTGFSIRRVGSERRTSLGSRQVTAELPPSVIAPGGARARNFFDDYPAFFRTSSTGPHPTRLNLRYEAIIGQNLDLFEGARVLDLASHDGRWSFAALSCGASHVTGIEGRPELVEQANKTFAEYGADSTRYRFIAGDVFKALAEEQIEADVVLCLGFIYHTLRYNELLVRISDSSPHALIIDSRVAVSPDPLVFVRTEPWALQRNAISDEYTRGDRVLTGRPTATALETMVSAYGFDVERYSDWSALLRDNPVNKSVDVYRKGQRVTMRCINRYV